jgi:Zn-dependent protease with chaperone function
MLKVAQNNILGGAVAVTEKQFPEYHKLIVTAARRLCMPVPSVFIKYNPAINAYSLGFTSSPTVVLHSALVEALTEDELLQVLGHEFSHIKCGHTFWNVIAGSTTGAQIPILTEILKLVFQNWNRRAEYTADRGGLLSSRSVPSAIGTLGKLAVGKELYSRLQVDEFLKQETAVRESQFTMVAEAFMDHPYTVKRMKEMTDFENSAVYQELTRLVD